MRIAVRIVLACLGLLAVTARVRGQETDTPQTTPQARQTAQNANEINAVPNRPTLASTAEMVQLGVLEIEYGFEAAKGHQNINGLLKWGAVKNLELWLLNNPIERDVATAGLGDSGVGFKYKPANITLTSTKECSLPGDRSWAGLTGRISRRSLIHAASEENGVIRGKLRDSAA